MRTAAQAYHDLIQLDRELVAEGGLREFTRLAWALVETSPQMVWNWHIDVICEHLEAVSRGEIRNLLINVPPGTMKSLLVSTFWPACEWIDNPGSKFLFASYAQDLSEKNAKMHRDIILSQWFHDRWGDLCAITKESTKKVRLFENDRRGFRFTTSTGGQATGRHADYIVGDDLVKAQDAEGRAAIDAEVVCLPTSALGIPHRFVAFLRQENSSVGIDESGPGLNLLHDTLQDARHKHVVVV